MDNKMPPPPNWWHFSQSTPRRMIRTEDGSTLATIEPYETPSGRVQFRVMIEGCAPHRARSFKAAWRSVVDHFEYVEPKARRQTPAITFENAPLRYQFEKGAGGCREYAGGRPRSRW